MYERFTQRAKKVMQLANQEAQRINHEYIGTEHILLGLVKEGSGTAANVLKNLDVDLRELRLEVEKRVEESGPQMIMLNKLPQTPRAKKVIEYAMEEARALHHNYVGIEHLLLGLLRTEDGIASEVLVHRFGLNIQKVSLAIKEILGQHPAPTPDAAQLLAAGQILMDMLQDAGANTEEVDTLLNFLRRPQPSSGPTDELASLYLSVVRGHVIFPLERLVAGLKNRAQAEKPTPHS